MADLEKLADQVLSAARAAGAEAADTVVVDSDHVSMEIRQGALETAERAEGIEIGLRVLMGHRQANVSTSDIRSDAIAAMAERAVAMAREAPEDPYCGLADPDQLAQGRDAEGLAMADPAPRPTPEALSEAARAAEAAALAMDGISQVSDAGAGMSRTALHLAATNGFSGGYARTSHTLHCVAISGTGLEMERDYSAETRIRYADLPDPEEVGQLAAERALSRRGAAKPPTGAFPVVFDERIAGSLIGHLTGAINGSAIARGTSWLKDAMDEAVLPAGLSLITDPLLPGFPSTRPFDGEGLPTARRALVEDGVLKSWLLDLAHARKLGLPPTGDAIRGTSAPPNPGLGNLELTPGSQDQAALVREMGEGLLVTSLMGASINPNTGDYSRGASGFWVRGGEVAEPVNECTIAGNLREMLMTITPANDARPHLARRVPSLRVEGLTIAGN